MWNSGTMEIDQLLVITASDQKKTTDCQSEEIQFLKKDNQSSSTGSGGWLGAGCGFGIIAG